MILKKTILLSALALVILAIIAGCAAPNTPEADTGDRTADTTDTAPVTADTADATDGAVTADDTGAVDSQETGAVYLGVYGYGTEIARRENMNVFQYRFEVDGQERLYRIDNGEKNDAGEYSYPVQNALKIGYSYKITAVDGIITGVTEIAAPAGSPDASYQPPVSGESGLKTVKNFLKTALGPVGTALYIYGGGWDWQDVGGSVQVKSIGVAEDWVRFFRTQDSFFTYRDKDGDEKNKDPEHSYYPYNEYNEYFYAGLDCSGYVSWVLNNTFNRDVVEDDLFSGSRRTANNLAERGYGIRTQDSAYTIRPGDVISIGGHVWLSLGTCEDGSIVIVHSTPSDSRAGQPGGGVQISAVGNSESCQAYQLADKYMSEFYPEWYSRYPAKLCAPATYLNFSDEFAGVFSWDVSGAGGGLTDPDGIQAKAPAEVLAELFAPASR